MNQRVKAAEEMFNDGYSCSQAIVAAFANRFGLDKDTALRLASGLGGGVGRTGGICGAVTGAILILGLKFGTTDPKNTSAKYECYKKVQFFCDEFKTRAGSLICRELIGFDFNTPDGIIKSKQPSAFEHCPGFVQTAAEILESMLEK